MDSKHTFTPPRKIVTVYNRSVDISTPAGQKAYTILRQCEIFSDSGSIINKSCNIDTVINRIPLYESALKFLAGCSAPDLKMCRLKTPEEFSAMYSAWLKKKPVVVNAALSRAYEDTVFQASKLKTAKGQDKRVLAFFDHCADMPELDANNLRYLQGLIRKHMDSIS